MMKLELLGVDETKDELAIFYIDRGEDLNAYIWSYVDGYVDITDIYGMERYCRHSVSGIYVGEDMPKELIEKAYENIKNMPEEELKEKLDAFNERDKQLKQDEERYREREEYEDACIGDIKNGEFGEDGLYWFM